MKRFLVVLSGMLFAAALRAEVTEAEWQSLRLAVDDLTAVFKHDYVGGPAYLRRLDELQAQQKAAATPEAQAAVEVTFRALKREALLANPLLNFDDLLVVKRRANNLGLPNNWESNSSLPQQGYENEICRLALRGTNSSLQLLFQPPDGRFVGDVDLHFDGRRFLFSMPGSNGRWQVHEMNVDGTGLRELPLIPDRDVDNYDACYLPNEDIVFCSTAPMVGVPCVRGSAHVCNLYLYKQTSGAIRRLTFDQDHNWCPTVLQNGNVLYLRWEYSDIPHFVSRILFQMSPDGTGQMAHYGSNSYWPNALFYARPVPGHPSRFVGIVGGHHDQPRMGELVLFDTSLGNREADGVVQRIPGRGKEVQPIILDGLIGNSWPKFLHPFPLSSDYHLVSARPSPSAHWGIYLADTFDNLTLIKEVPGFALLEPVPVRGIKRPPVVPEKVDLKRKDATIYIADLYVGDGLKGIPRGAVKQLRLFTYHFSYHGMGGQIDRVGLDGPWDVKRVLGTVPVEPDGSALFHVPANTPISIQPLDAEGKALQLMRSWMTAMPGEAQSCVGCHEAPRTPPPAHATRAARRAPSEITPWYGPTRGFSFVREVQPVLDAYCIRCHDGKASHDTVPLPDFRRLAPVHPAPDGGYQQGATFTPAYLALRRYTRSPTIESDMHILMPGEFHADTSELVRRLQAGHHKVMLDAEAWDRLVTWIDLGTPAHGTWHEICGWDRVKGMRDRRRELSMRYAGIDEDPEAVPEGVDPDLAVANASASAVPSPAMQPPVEPVAVADMPERKVDLGGGVSMTLRRLSPGAFVMGSDEGLPHEAPPAVQHIRKPFWMGVFEVTNEQFARFDPEHDSRLEHGDFLQFSVEERGYPVNRAAQPVVRMTWARARAFSRWLSERTGEPFDLPTEAQWEYACRAGGASPLFYGTAKTDFARMANLADKRLRHVDTFSPWGLPSGAIYPWRPAIAVVDDGARVSADVGSYRPNAWGLHDMHGNVAEWTRSSYGPYPYDDQRNDAAGTGRRVVRGGSWYDRPAHARSAARRACLPWLGVFDVGFRVVCESP